MSWTNTLFDDAKKQVRQMVNQCMDVEEDDEIDASPQPDNSKKQIHPFQLPISYLPKEQLHPISEVVQQDLELVVSKSETSRSMYNHLFQPSHPFAEQTIQEWKGQYTSNIPYLEETQQVIQSTDENATYAVEYSTLMDIWKDTKENDAFLEKYHYIEWDMFKNLNKSSGFLQAMTITNMMSPVISLILPLLFLIFPFIILKIRGIPITVSIYMEVLTDIAKYHFIGKTLTTLRDLSLEKLMYLVMGFMFYFYQLYQNTLMCVRFYKHIHRINRFVVSLKSYVQTSIQNMEAFANQHESKSTYGRFCKTVRYHAYTLKRIHTLFDPIYPISNFMFKMGGVGYLLKCYYEVHSNVHFEQSLRYSFGFEGFLDNLRGIKKHLDAGSMQCSMFSQTESTHFRGQYYPPYYADPTHVKNNCHMQRKMIITGPNASGKTTYLKTTTLNILFTQQFGCGFYQNSVLRPYTHIHSYLNIPDTSERDSLFQAESRRCKDILSKILEYPEEKGERHFCIFDELYSGTNPSEATKAAYAFMKYLTQYSNVDFILTTHYVSVCKKLKKNREIQMRKMDVVQEKGGSLKYTYVMKSGISKIEGAIHILKEMDYPQEILDDIQGV